jgi:hypothetical protein
MQFFILIPFLVQALVIGIDEYYFHLKRGLPKWERIGHPLDTLSVVLCIAFAIFIPYSSELIKIFVCCAVFSCFMVTKDEFVHKQHCPGAEHWLHALLFINHPLMLTALGILWAALEKDISPPWVANWLSNSALLRSFLYVQFSIAICFFLYQAIYWNFLWQEKE